MRNLSLSMAISLKVFMGLLVINVNLRKSQIKQKTFKMKLSLIEKSHLSTLTIWFIIMKHLNN